MTLSDYDPKLIDRIRPKLRGIPAAFASALAVPPVAWLIASAPQGTPRISAACYGLGLLTVFIVSALYHAPTWKLSQLRHWRALDHAAIYVQIAGAYVPIALLKLPDGTGRGYLIFLGTMVVIGTIKSWLWPSSPRWLNVSTYLMMGWSIVPYLPEIVRVLDERDRALFVAGGLVYSIGALFYARRWPNPIPGVFGYHEVFHVTLVIAGALHFVAFQKIILG